MRANASLLEWGAAQGLEWDRFDDPNGDGFGSRYESYITDPGEEPDPMKWSQRQRFAWLTSSSPG
jgi:hypothetical protein